MTTTASPRRARRLVAGTSLVVVASAALAGCVPIPPLLPPPGIARPATEQHAVSAEVHALRLETVGDVVVRLGDEPGLAVRAPQGVLERLTVDEVDGVLVLGATPGPGWFGGLLRYELTVTSFDAVELRGAGEVRADFSAAETVSIRLDGSGDVEGAGLAADAVDVELDGSGDVRLEGTARTGALRVSGSGDVSAGRLRFIDALAEVEGSGDITLFASGSVDAAISGSGDIVVRGNPHVTRDVSGSGEVVGA